jgi:hypothetical protein
MSNKLLAVLCSIGLFGIVYSIATNVVSLRHLHHFGVLQQARILTYQRLSSSHGSSLKALVEYHVDDHSYSKTVVVPNPATDPDGHFVRFQQLGSIPMLYDPKNPVHAKYAYIPNREISLGLIIAIAFECAGVGLLYTQIKAGQKE